MNRFDKALTIQDGACNPSGIAMTIFECCKDIRAEGGGTSTIRKDPAIRLMVHQLAYLCNVSEFDNDLYAYGKATDSCKQKYEAGI